MIGFSNPPRNKSIEFPLYFFKNSALNLKHALSAGMVYPAYWPSCGPSFADQNLRLPKYDDEDKKKKEYVNYEFTVAMKGKYFEKEKASEP